MRNVRIDPWSYYDFKSRFREALGTTGSSLAPVWVGAENMRRLNAYKLLESYYRNIARDWLSGEASEEQKQKRREYGDVSTIVDQALSSLLGDDQSIVVPDANGDDADESALMQQEALLDWSEKEQFILKMHETELNACKLGDGVYVLGWNETLRRPRLYVYDPGFYFPVLEAEDDTGQYPQRIHIAYEYRNDNDELCIRRISWELVETEEPRSYPWNEDPVYLTCLMSDMVWKIDNTKAKTPDDLLPSQAVEVYLQEEDIELDFIPVVHVPNSIAVQEHYGTSVVAKVMQLFDDVVSTDTDLQAASATTGTPPIALSGSSAPKDENGNIKTYGPGTVFETGDGTATVIDTSMSLDALMKYSDSLLKRLSVNSKTPESLLGRVKPNEVPSGIALTLSFTPHSGMVKEMRLVRKTKYALFWKMVSRFLLKNGDIDEIFPVDLQFGSFLPSDASETATLVQTLLTVNAISLETAVAMLVAAGYPIENAALEVLKIRAVSFDAANKLLEATGDVNAVRDFIGLPTVPLDLLQPPAPPAPPAPPSGDQQL